MTETVDGAKPVAKTQKNALLDDELCVLLDFMQRITGATFARLTTAAFLRYLFGGWVPPLEWSGQAEDPVWMGLAVDIERGDRTIAGIPLFLLDRCATVTDRVLSSFNMKEELSKNKEEERLRWIAFNKKVKEVRRHWTKAVADLGSEAAAIQMILEGRGFVPIDAVVFVGF